MPIKFVCQSCRQFLSVSRRKIGKAIDCPLCGHAFQVPNEVAAEAYIDQLKTRKETRQLNAELKHPEFAVFDEPPGATAASMETRSDPRQHQQQNGTRQHPLRSPQNGSGAGDHADAGASRQHTPVATPVRQATPAPTETLVRADSGAEERLERRRRGMQRNGRILKAAGIMVFGAALFMAGWFVGRSGTSLGGWGDDEQIVVAGGISYIPLVGGTPDGDRGSVILVLPVGEIPSRKIDIAGLAPGSGELSPNNTGVLAIEEMGGAYARADAQGEFQLKIPVEGEYHVLIVSANTQRSTNERFLDEDSTLLLHYFNSGSGLVGDQRYRLFRMRFAPNPERVSHLFKLSG